MTQVNIEKIFDLTARSRVRHVAYGGKGRERLRRLGVAVAVFDEPPPSPR